MMVRDQEEPGGKGMSITAVNHSLLNFGNIIEIGSTGILL